MGRIVASAVAAGAVVAFSGGAAVGQGKDAPAAWTRKPTAEELFAVFPSEAVRKGITGKVSIECEAALDGVLKGCTVVSEDPPGMGFGAAALALAPQFELRPAIVNGRPASSQVRIPITFHAPSSAGSMHRIPPPAEGGSVKTITRMAWDRAPTRAEVREVHPASAAGGGFAIIDCVITDEGLLSRCQTAREEPRGRGLAKAARQLSDKFRAALLQVGDQKVSGMHVLVTVRFDPIDQPSAGLAHQLEWLAKPGEGDLAFPAEARAAGISEGRGVVDCRFSAKGLLEDCRLVDETPTGLGFGAAAMALTSRFLANPWSSEGRPVEGKRVRLPIVFVDAEAAPHPAQRQ